MRSFSPSALPVELEPLVPRGGEKTVISFGGDLYSVIGLWIRRIEIEKSRSCSAADPQDETGVVEQLADCGEPADQLLVVELHRQLVVDG